MRDSGRWHTVCYVPLSEDSFSAIAVGALLDRVLVYQREAGGPERNRRVAVA
jgi:hypothetical protein